MELQDIKDIGKQPIKVDSPAGDNVRLEAIFDDLQAEIEKSNSPTSSSPTDWERVVRLSVEILTKHSKDVLVGVYLCFGLFKVYGIKGLYIGFKVLSDLLNSFPEDIYPHRAKGRENALMWLKEKLESEVENANYVFELDENQEKQLLNFIDDVEDYIVNHLNGNVSLSLLKNALKDKFNSKSDDVGEQSQPQLLVEKEENEKELSEFIASERKKIEEKQTEETNEETEADAQEMLKKALELLSRISDIYFQQSIYNPDTYRINRLSAWFQITEPPIAKDKHSFVPPPDENIKLALKKLVNSGSWTDVVKMSESYLPQFVFWLDLNYYSYIALKALRQDECAGVVALETLFFIKRINGIMDYKFSDGTPFADSITKKWIKDVIEENFSDLDELVKSKTDQTKIVISKGQAESHIESFFDRAKRIYDEQSLGDALEYLSQQSYAIKSNKDKLTWYIQMCMFLLKTKRKRMALPYVKEILSLIDQHNLEKWDPDTTVEGLSVALEAIRRNKAKELKDLEDHIIERLSIIKPELSIKFF